MLFGFPSPIFPAMLLAYPPIYLVHLPYFSRCPYCHHLTTSRTAQCIGALESKYAQDELEQGAQVKYFIVLTYCPHSPSQEYYKSTESNLWTSIPLSLFLPLIKMINLPSTIFPQMSAIALNNFKVLIWTRCFFESFF